MIRLKDSQETLISQIDAVVAALNENRINQAALVEQGMKAIHAAIASKAHG